MSLEVKLVGLLLQKNQQLAQNIKFSFSLPFNYA